MLCSRSVFSVAAFTFVPVLSFPSFQGISQVTSAVNIIYLLFDLVINRVLTYATAISYSSNKLYYSNNEMFE